MPPPNPRYLARDGMKRCIKCERELPVSAFYQRKSTDGYRNDCKDCVRSRSVEWYQGNRDQVLERKATEYAENREELREKQKARYSPDRAREYRKANQEHIQRRAREARAADPEKYRHHDRVKALRKYGLTIEQYDALLQSQGSVCAICSGPPNGKGNYHVDHDHATGRVRGLLCHSCNVAIGSLREDPELFRNALRYLANPPAVQDS